MSRSKNTVISILLLHPATTFSRNSSDTSSINYSHSSVNMIELISLEALKTSPNTASSPLQIMDLSSSAKKRLLRSTKIYFQKITTSSVSNTHNHVQRSISTIGPSPSILLKDYPWLERLSQTESYINMYCTQARIANVNEWLGNFKIPNLFYRRWRLILVRSIWNATSQRCPNSPEYTQYVRRKNSPIFKNVWKSTRGINHTSNQVASGSSALVTTETVLGLKVVNHLSISSQKRTLVHIEISSSMSTNMTSKSLYRSSLTSYFFINSINL